MSRNYLQSDDFRRFDQQFVEGEDKRNARLRKLQWCVECGRYPADPPSAICPGCEANKEHQS